MTEMPTHERLIEVAALLPPDLAKEMTAWNPAVQGAVLAGLATVTNEIERTSGPLDPVRYEAVITGLAYVLRRRVEARWRQVLSSPGLT